MTIFPLPVLIVAYKKPELLKRCVDSVLDSTVELLPWIHDNSETNIGLTVAANTLITRALLARISPYAVWCGHDVVFEPQAIENAVTFMEQHPRCAIGGFKQLLARDRDFIYHAGCTTALPGCHIQGRVSKGEHEQSRQVTWVNGAAVILRLDALRTVGMLDEKLKLVGQDSDLCYRANMAGWECWYVADAVCTHEVGVSANPPPELQPIIQADMAYWAEKWGKRLEQFLGVVHSLDGSGTDAAFPGPSWLAST